MEVRQILLRTDTAANWASVNPVLGAGEIGTELDTQRLKVGDGVTAWLDLGYGRIDLTLSRNASTVTVGATGDDAILPAATGSLAGVMSAADKAKLDAITVIGDAQTTAANVFTGANSFFNGSGQTFGTEAAIEDGIIIAGRDGGTGSYRVRLQPEALSGNHTLSLPDRSGTVITSGDSGTVTSAMIANGTIVNEDIAANAAIADTKLATITTAGKVANSATTAASTNTASAIVARDGSGNFSAGTITATLSGNASTATALSSSRSIALTGDVTGSVSSDLSSGASISTAIAAGAIVDADINAAAAIADTKLATIATANKVSASAVDIDGATDIGSALADTDLVLVDDGGAGSNRKAAVSRFSAYAFAKVTGDITIAEAGTAAIGAAKVTNAMLAGSIADSKLSTITTAGKVANSATTATNLNTASAIVARDASGNFSAGTITAALSGNATTATALATPRTINGVSFDGSANVTITANTPSTLTFNNSGTGGASGTNFNGGSAITVSYNTVGAPSVAGANATGTWGISITGNAGTVTNGVYTTGDQTIAGSKVFTGSVQLPNLFIAAENAGAGEGGQLALARSSLGTLAGDVVIDVNGNALRIFEGSGAYRGVTLDITGCASQSVLLHSNNVNSYAPTLTGTGASGTWGISVTGNAGTVTNGVYTSGDQTIGGVKTLTSPLWLNNGTYGRINTLDQYHSIILRGSVSGTSTQSIGDANQMEFIEYGADWRFREVTPSTNKVWFQVNSTSIWYNSQVVLHAGNYNSYAPTFTGTGASGTWGISVTGNAATATKLATPRTINGVSFDGSANITISSTLANSITFNNSGSGSASGAAFDGQSAITVSYNTIGAPSTTGTNASGTWGIGISGNAATATKLATARAINGVNFDGTAGITITANTPNALTFNNSGSGVASGGTFTGGSAVTVSYNSVGAPSTTGTNASGTWGINITGNAATVSRAVFSEEAFSKDDITTRTATGFYQTGSGTKAKGWPTDSGSWHYMIASTHWNGANYYSMQIGATFTDQELYFRNTNGSGATAWKRLLHESNYTDYTAQRDGTGAYGTWGINVTGSAGSVAWSNVASKPAVLQQSDLGGVEFYHVDGQYYTSVHGVAADFDNFVRPGSYHVTNVTSNAPIAAYGYLEVLQHQRSNYGLQRYYPTGTYDRHYVRYAYDNGSGSRVWTGWHTYPTLHSENTWTAANTFSALLTASGTGKTATFGGTAGGPNAAIANQTSYIELVAGAGGAASSFGLVFHNKMVSTSVLEYVNTDVNTGYFNFRSDDVSWNARVNGNAILHAGNYNSYAPTLTGTGASGTWGINITGSSTSCTGNAGSVTNGAYITAPNNFSQRQFFSAPSGSASYDVWAGAIEVREVGYVGNTQTTSNYAPAINFHWANVGASAIKMFSDASIRITAQGNTDSTTNYRNLHAAEIYSNGALCLHSGNYGSYALPLSGGTVSGTLNAQTSVVYQYQYVRHIEGKGWSTYDTAPAPLYLNYTNNEPVYIGSSSHLALHAGNYNSYAPTLTGTGASGTWGISVTGSAGQTPYWVNGTHGTNEIKAGTGDGASYTTYNMAIRSWYGIGFRDYTDNSTVQAFLDCRTGDFSTKGKLTAADTVLSSINSGPLAGFRNAIINGSFDHWQRGTSFNTNAYSADRWVHVQVGSSSTLTRQQFTYGQTDVPGNPKYYCRSVVQSVAGASNAAGVYQNIEGVETFSGQQVTVSFWAKADGAKPIAVNFLQYFGTTGSPSAVIDGIAPGKYTLSTSWQKIVHTATIPSVSGKTITENESYLRLAIFYDAGSNLNARTNNLGQQSGTFEIAQVQVELGPVATPFERRSIGTELALCQRYYEIGNYLSSYFYSSAWQPDDKFEHVSFKVTKRAVPNIGGTFTGAGWTGSWSTANATNNGFRFGNSATTNAGSFTHQADWTASAEL